MAAVVWEQGSARPPARRAHLRVVPSGDIPDGAGRPRPAAVYRRRRAVVAAVVAAATVALAAGPLSGGAPPALRDAPASGPPVTVVVGQGETLWDVVGPHLPTGAHPMAYVVEVAAHNEVDPRDVAPGTVLRLPAVGP